MKLLLVTFILFVASTHALSGKPKAPQDQCSSCEQIVGFMEGWIENNATDAEIEQYLDTLCKLIPGITALCDQISEWGLAYVINYIKTNENPQTLCQQFGLCTTNLPADDTQCSGCTTLVGAIEAWVASSATESEIEAALDTICQMVPALGPACDAIVAQLPTIIAYLEASDNATVVCQLIGLCPTSKPKAPSSGECAPCEELLGAIETWVVLNRTEVVIENDLFKVICPLVPAYTKTCQQIMKVGVPTVISYLVQTEDPTTVCTQIGACSSKVVNTATPLFKGPIGIN